MPFDSLGNSNPLRGEDLQEVNNCPLMGIGMQEFTNFGPPMYAYTV